MRGIRIVAQYYDFVTGETIEESILGDEKLSKAETLNELGYLYVEQFDFLKKYKISKFSVKCVGESLEMIKTSSNFGANSVVADELIVTTHPQAGGLTVC